MRSRFLHFLLSGDRFSPRSLAALDKDFPEAIAAHSAWKNRFREALHDGCIDPRLAREAGDEGACNLGKWILGAGYKRYGHLSSFNEIRQQHTKFHQLAREIVELQRAAEYLQAEEVMSKHFEDSSRKIVGLLRTFAEGDGPSEAQT